VTSLEMTFALDYSYFLIVSQWVYQLVQMSGIRRFELAFSISVA
jgi:hypothetical protein